VRTRGVGVALHDEQPLINGVATNVLWKNA